LQHKLQVFDLLFDHLMIGLPELLKSNSEQTNYKYSCLYQISMNARTQQQTNASRIARTRTVDSLASVKLALQWIPMTRTNAKVCPKPRLILISVLEIELSQQFNHS
jgi:hypothetical protein